MPGKLNLKINQGETFKHSLKWTDADGVAINLTGASARMQVRASVDAAQPLLTFSSDPLTNPDGSIVLGGAAGTIDLKLSAIKTAAINWITGVYDLEIVDSLDDVTRLVEGKVTVTKEVTR
jgi:hypothetical protein